MAIDNSRLAHNEIYATTAPPAELAADMEALAGLDAYYERKHAVWRRVSIGCWILVPITGFGAIIFWPLLAATVVFVIAGSLSAGKWGSYGRLDLPDRRYQMVANLLPLIEADMAPGAELALALDLRAAESEEKQSGTGEAGAWNVTYFKDPWLSLQGRFVDGTKFAISFVHHLQKRKRWKRSASGKSKLKVKYKGKNTAIVQLRAKPQKYPRLPELSDGLASAVQLPHHATLVQAHIDGHRMVMKASVDDAWSEDGDAGSQVIAMMLLSLYQVLNLAKTIDKRQSAA